MNKPAASRSAWTRIAGAVAAIGRGNPDRAGGTAGVIVAAPLAGLVLLLPVVAAAVDRYNGGGNQPDTVAILVAPAAMAVLAAAAIPGALWGPRSFRPEGIRAGDIAMMSVLAVLVGATALVAAFGLVGTFLGGGSIPDAVAVGAVAWAFGLILFGLPALLIVVPHVLVWRSLMRRVRQRDVARAMDAVLGG